MAAADRGPGEPAGVSCVHVDPSHIQVSASPPGGVPSDDPPKRMVAPVASSYAMDASDRAEGEVAGVCCVQFDPSNVQVSASVPPPAPVPPNITTTFAARSDAAAAPKRAGGDVSGACLVHVGTSQVHVSP